MRVAHKFNNSVVGRSFSTLTGLDQRKIVAVILIQILFGLFDLIGVALIGVLGALTVNGVQSKAPGDRVGAVLQFMQLETFGLRNQAIIIGCLASTFLVSKTILSVIFVRRTIFFLGRRSATLSAELISKVLAQPLIKLQSRSMQETLYAVTSGVESIALGVLNTTVLIISDLSLLIILSAGLFIVDATLASFTLISFSGIGFILFRLLQVRAVRLGERQRNLSIQSYEKILEVLSSYREIVVRNRRNYYVTKLGSLRYELANVNAERMFMPNISKYVIELSVVGGSLLIALVQFSIHDATHAVSVLSVFLAASTRISPAILRLQQGAISIKSNIGSAGPTLDLIESLASLKVLTNDSHALDFEHKDFPGCIDLNEVTFTYPGKKEAAILNISLKITEGSVVSFVGQSGAGKTTLADLILGVLEPDSGEIRIGDLEPINAIKRWPGAVGYVPQDVLISNGTVRQNVALGYSEGEISDARIWEALGSAQLEEFVRELPLGLDTPVGDRGSRLSGGQRQRLGIARAMCTLPKLLVLDEATSSLDGGTEADISRAINQLRGKVTVIMIAHRLSTVKNSDVVHYLSEGKLQASGTFSHVRSEIPEFDRQASLMGL